jgi:DNA excision repair protein ERCC-4
VSEPTPDISPVVIVDTREQIPLPIRRLPVVVGTLRSGDYSLAGAEELFAVERKSIADLVACCVGDNRDRFERELHRLRGFMFSRLLVVGTRADVEQHRYKSNITPKSVLHTLAAFEARYVPVVWALDPESAARLVESWAYWFARELVKSADEMRKHKVSVVNPSFSECTNDIANAEN